MRRGSIQLLTFLACILLSITAQAFVIKHIVIRGNTRIQKQTILNYLPVTVGDRLTIQNSNHVIQALYQTGFFSKIALYHDNGRLIIKVVDRPVIGLIHFTGNSEIPDKNIKSILKQVGLVQGRTFKPALLKTVTQSLQAEYQHLGYYSAQVTPEISPEESGHIDVIIKIDEGSVLKVAKITFSGNHHFSESDLVDQLKMKVHHWWSWLTGNDKYSEMGLQQDLQGLRNFYFDHGYLKFHVIKNHVTFNQDKTRASIHIQVSEGSISQFGVVHFVGNLGRYRSAVIASSVIEPNTIFSRQKVLDTVSKIQHLLGNAGYAFPMIRPIPHFLKNHKVAMTFHIRLGKRVYVNQIHFSGNTKTADYVLRREMRQFEQSPFSLEKIQESKRRLLNLGYIKNVQVVPVPVSGTKDEVNLNYKVTDASSAEASVQFGYSDAYGFLYGASVSEQNFLGTGKHLGINLQHSQYMRQFRLAYTNPYYTPDGISRGFSVYGQTTDADEANLVSYSTNELGANVSYGMPISEYDQVNASLDVSRLNLITGNLASKTINRFTTRYGKRFNPITATLGWSFNDLDNSFSPNQGTAQSASLQVGMPFFGTSLPYYKMRYNFRHYQPLAHHFIFQPEVSLGYANGYGRMASHLPFFKNFYAGGLGTAGQIRGYEANSLGPKEAGDAIGANIIATANFNLITPQWISRTVRTGVFFDIGNVYQDRLSWSKTVASFGVQVSWYTPLGAPLLFSLSKPLDTKGEDVRHFQFNIGFGF